MTIHRMKNIYFLQTCYILLLLCSFGCSSENKVALIAKVELPSRNHDLSYTPYDAKFDNPNYIICDSTGISSGRNRLQYIGGTNKLRKDITTKYVYRQEYETFTGYIVIRFLVNCEGQSGRYRVQSLNLDFSPSNAPSDLLNHTTEIVKSLDNWTKSAVNGPKKEYSKFINLKITNGKIQHVLL